MRKNLRVCYITSVVILLLLPWVLMYMNPIPFLFIIFILILWMAFTDKPGYSLVIMSLCLCRPVLFYGGFEASAVRGYFLYLNYFYFFLPLVLSIILILKRKLIPYISALFLSFVYILIGLIYNDQIYHQFYIISCTHLAFFVCYHDRIPLKDTFKLFSVLFILTAIYAALEFHFKICPYSEVYYLSNSYDNINSVGRAVGLFGNPLILCVVAIIYLAFLYSQNLSFKNVPYLLVLICIYVLLIVVSRTAIISFIGLSIVYFFSSRIFKTITRTVRFTFFFLVTALLLSVFFGDVIDSLTFRLEYSTASHRLSSYQTTINILSDKLFGLGSRDFGQKIIPYAAAGKEEGINTLDNFFLTQFGFYGILGFIMIYYYLFYFIKSFNYRRTNPVFFRQILLFFTAFCLVGFSFDLEAYFNIDFIIFGLLGLIFSNRDKLVLTS